MTDRAFSSNRPINDVEGAKGNSIKTLRQTDDRLDEALLKPNTAIESKERENDVEIASRLVTHGWNSHNIRKVLDKKRKRDKLSYHADGDYFEGVLRDAGYRSSIRHSDTYDSDDDSDDDSGVTTDSDVDSSKFEHIKFD